MTNEEIIQAIQNCLPQAIVNIGGDGHHIDAVIISELFADKKTLQRQRLIYQCLAEYITTGAIHAFTMQTFTPEEWEKTHG